MALLLVGCGSDLPEGLTVSGGGMAVSIGEGWRDCEVDADCTLVETACGGCCLEGVVATDRLEEFEQAWRDVCADAPYECECEPQPERVAACRQGRCWALLAEDE